MKKRTIKNLDEIFDYFKKLEIIPDGIIMFVFGKTRKNKDLIALISLIADTDLTEKEKECILEASKQLLLKSTNKENEEKN